MRVMVRPHYRDFVYSDSQISMMKKTIDLCKALETEGVVFGCTELNGKKMNIPLIQDLADYAYPIKVTIHKAMDSCENPLIELNRILNLTRIDALLTSGKSPTAIAGVPMLKEMIQLVSDHIDIIVCGKVTADNIESIHEILGAKFYHGKKIVGSLV